MFLKHAVLYFNMQKKLRLQEFASKILKFSKPAPNVSPLYMHVYFNHINIPDILITNCGFCTRYTVLCMKNLVFRETSFNACNLELCIYVAII